MAQIKFFRGDRKNFFNGDGAFNSSDYGDAICFLTDSHELVVNGDSYGLSDSLKENLEGKIITGGEYTNDGLVLSFADGSKSDAIVIPTVSSSSNGLMTSSDKSKLDVLTEALLNEKNEIVKASKDNDGLFSKEDYELLQTLSGAAGAENVANRLNAVETNFNKLEGTVNTISTAVESLRDDVGNWVDTTTTITQTIGGLGVRVGDLEDQITGLSGAMHFKGVLETLPVYDAEKAGEWTYEAGDVIIVGEKEYVCVEKVSVEGTAIPFVFVEFGDANNLATTSQLQAVEKKADDNTAAISALDALVQANSGKLSALETLAGTNKTDITSLTERVDTQDEKIEGIENILTWNDVTSNSSSES